MWFMYKAEIKRVTQREELKKRNLSYDTYNPKKKKKNKDKNERQS